MAIIDITFMMDLILFLALLWLTVTEEYGSDNIII